MGKLFGYARVSTDDQDLTVQREALKAAGVSSRLIFKETASGTKREGRDELNRMLELAHEGDTIVITRIDRLARSMKDLQDIVHELKEKGVLLKATEQPIDTSNSMGKMFFDMLGVFAEFETNIRRERQAEGIAKAKSKGAYKGRKRSVDRERVKELGEQGLGPTAIAKELGATPRHVRRLLRELGFNEATNGRRKEFREGGAR
jgi:DNA invertase Pin-like site-specific DNA recombinase